MSTSEDGYKSLFLAALYHLRCVSGSRNSFDWSKFAPERMPPRLPEVEQMHTAAAAFLQEHDDGTIGEEVIQKKWISTLYLGALRRATEALRSINQSSGQSWVRRTSREALEEASAALRGDADLPQHAVALANPADGFAPALVSTTTHGARYLLDALRKMEPEAPETALHKALFEQLEQGCVSEGQTV
ncbi:hypothetical protein [Ottowia sp.]|uniref:hypothetical protein n=1 Tax=Ottowia sp. TaxID=1898956 RepID=UPI0025E0A912|nr:hypothetical protein [Ottowia sp.]MBK6616355.1 hypothetical protein [Ottowia sp.]